MPDALRAGSTTWNCSNRSSELQRWRRPFHRQDGPPVDHEGAAQKPGNDGSQHDRRLVGGDQVLALAVAEDLPRAAAGHGPPDDGNLRRRLDRAEPFRLSRIVGGDGGRHRHPGQTQPLQLVVAREAFQMDGRTVVEARAAGLQARQQAVEQAVALLLPDMSGLPQRPVRRRFGHRQDRVLVPEAMDEQRVEAVQRHAVPGGAAFAQTDARTLRQVGVEPVRRVPRSARSGAAEAAWRAARCAGATSPILMVFPVAVFRSRNAA